MIILLDTATPVCRLSVVDGESMMDYTWEAHRELSRGLLKFLDDNTGGFHDISGIGVFRGPGSFTGLRIGLAVANSLADSLSVPIVGETGDDWKQRAIDRIQQGSTDGIVLPLYGAGAHITAPRK